MSSISWERMVRAEGGYGYGGGGGYSGFSFTPQPSRQVIVSGPDPKTLHDVAYKK